jgi:hypothetical protein
MRHGVFLLFLAIALAAASPAALAQLSPPPLQDVVKPGKGPNPDKPAKPDKEPKPDKGGQEAGPGDDEEGGPGDDEEGGPGDDEEGGPVPEEDGNGDEGETGGESGGGESGADIGPVGNGPAGPDRSTNGSSSADEGGPAALVSNAGCPEECDPPEDLTDGGEPGSILASDVAGEFVHEAGARSTLAAAAAGASPAVLALFVLMVLGLLVGLVGGLRALQGRIRGS